jgi:alanyl-tRNA synthetase
MTERLYYSDPFSREFDATVASVDDIDSANGRARVRLDRTSFYPTSGGQPFDTGRLESWPVVDVVDEDDGEVVHVLDLKEMGRSASVNSAATPLAETSPTPAAPALLVGARVHGVIDWPRRFDHMQQHSGQHVLSAAFVRLFGARTVSFHLGSDASTIDLERELTARELAAAEDEANRIVHEDRPVTIRFASAEEAAALPLRKEPARSGMLRLIDVEDFDLSACGGTHVARTGQIGLVAVTAWERFKGGQRLDFHCGRRALVKLRSLRDMAAAGAKLLSVPGSELPAAIERMQAEAKDSRHTLAALRSEVVRYQADVLAATAEITSSGRFVFKAVDADANVLKALATAIVSAAGLGAVLVSTSRPALVVIGRAPDVATASNEILARLISTFGGRGGGKADLAQAGGLDAAAEAILEEARKILR